MKIINEVQTQDHSKRQYFPWFPLFLEAIEKHKEGSDLQLQLYDDPSHSLYECAMITIQAINDNLDWHQKMEYKIVQIFHHDETAESSIIAPFYNYPPKSIKYFEFWAIDD